MAGAKFAKEARTLMQRFLLGHPETGLIRMPLVLGISATPRRFMDLLEQAPHTVHKVSVPADDVRQSGLLKDRILIHHPEATTNAEMALLEEAARRWSQMTQRWAEYCKAEKEQTVWPILVVRVENGTEKQLTRTNLPNVLSAIESAIGRRLNEGEIAHAMHDTGDLDVGGRRIRRVDASRIEEDKSIGVVLFKTSLSTGWDCPRAEVMMSFRRAEDHTYIAQLLGRMVRTPLARRITRDAALNDVHLFVPHFDTKAVQAVISDLQNVEDVPPSETGSARELVLLKRREGLEDIFKAFEKLITYRVNAVRAQSNLRRYIGITRGLTMDGIDTDAWPSSKGRVVDWMNQLVANLRESGEFDRVSSEIKRVLLRTLAVTNDTGTAEPEGRYGIEASDMDIDRLFEEAGRTLSNGLHMTYWQAHADRDATDVKIEVVVLAHQQASITEIERRANAEFDRLYDKHRTALYALREQRRTHYQKLRLATAKPNTVPWQMPETIDFRRPPDATRWERHLYVESDGQFRAELGAWEAGVLREELRRQDVVGWLRNVDRKQWSLEIPYTTGAEIRPMFPDVIARKEHEGYVFDVLEPHNPNFADNFEKAIGLARFAENHGHPFARIQLIRAKAAPGREERYVRLEQRVG